MRRRKNKEDARPLKEKAKKANFLLIFVLNLQSTVKIYSVNELTCVSKEPDQPLWKIFLMTLEKFRKKIIIPKPEGKSIPGSKKSSCSERKILQPKALR